MAEQPFLPFFVGDFLGATVTWEGEERALYMLMLAYQWSGGALPSDLARLSRVLGYPHERFMSLWKTVKRKFQVQGDVLLNERLERHREKTIELSQARSTAGSVGGKASAAAKRAAKAEAQKAAVGVANEEAGSRASDQATVEAIVEVWQTDGQANGTAKAKQNSTILSYPILSDQIRSDPMQKHTLRGGCEGGDGRDGKATRDGPEQAWRDVTECDPQAYEAWLQWRIDEHDVVPPRVRIQDAKFLGGKGTPEQQRAFIDELIRLRFKRLHDPIGRNGYPGGNGKHLPSAPAKTVEQLENEAIAKGIAEGRSDADIAIEIDVPIERVRAAREVTQHAHD